MANRSVKILESSTGISETFNSDDGQFDFRFVIEDNPAEPIHVYKVDKTVETNGFYIKIRCSNWNGATLMLQSKLKGDNDDVYSNTKDNFTEDQLVIFYYN